MFGSTWEALAPAKLNLYLEVLGRRRDGFHEVETLMAPIHIYDRLRWTPPDANEPHDFGLRYDPWTPAAYQVAAPADETNLAYRAALGLAEAAGIEPWGRMTLAKRIPPQAGLGGGSSDAAASLLVANAAWNIRYPRSRLVEIAAKLGSDVPFFLAGQSAICRGRGEVVEPLPAPPRLDVVIVKPPTGLNTAAVYQALGAESVSELQVRDSAGRLSSLVADLRRGALARAGRQMTNRLQRAAEGLCEWIERIGAAFDRLSCHGHLMTGSGSAYFGVMRSARHARRAAGILSSSHLGTVFAAATCR
jgi:4-diphosphocytidyl-2-C-methyl-D-erythritol kinase